MKEETKRKCLEALAQLEVFLDTASKEEVLDLLGLTEEELVEISKRGD